VISSAWVFQHPSGTTYPLNQESELFYIHNLIQVNLFYIHKIIWRHRIMHAMQKSPGGSSLSTGAFLHNVDVLCEVLEWVILAT